MLRRCTGRGQAGFTLLEITIVLAIVALITGFIMTRMVGRTVDGEAAALSRNLSSLSDAVSAFRQDVRRYPSRLSYLTSEPGNGTTDSCGNTLPARFRAYWRGPYAERSITTAGVATGTSTILDSVARLVPADTVIRISVSDVDEAVAELVDRSFEASTSLTAGTVQWTDAGGGRGVLTYDMPVRGC